MAEHVYLSTACLHGGHDLCRRVCKYCPAQCACDCHGAGERSQVTVELAPRADAELMDALRRALRSGRIVLRKPQPPDAKRRSEATPQKDLRSRCGATADSLLRDDEHVHQCSWLAGREHVHHCECGTDWTDITRTEHDRIADQLSRVDPYDTQKGFPS